MTPGFFAISDQNLKLRRNLLFTATLYMVHMTMVPLAQLKVFNVVIDISFLDIGLPVAILWFAFNYASTLTTEYVQWKSSHIDLSISSGIIEWPRKTLVPSLAKVTNEELELKVDFMTRKSIPGASLFPEETLNQNITDIMKGKLATMEAQFKTEIKRIEQFENAIDNYHALSQTKFWLLDVVIPLATVIISAALYFL